MRLDVTDRNCDCLRAVQKFSSNGWPARLKDISADLDVAGPTALGFLNSLMRKAFVEKGATGYRLTEKGLQRLRALDRSHRVFESLLFKVGVPLDEACAASSKVDSLMDTKAVDALCSHLGHPGKCPHGREIPHEAHGGRMKAGSVTRVKGMKSNSVRS